MNREIKPGSIVLYEGKRYVIQDFEEEDDDDMGDAFCLYVYLKEFYTKIIGESSKTSNVIQLAEYRRNKKEFTGNQ